MMNDVVWQSKNVSRQAQVLVPAAKLHVMGLASLKNALGEKWERLSGLVQKLFERAIEQAQEPSDYFVVLDELSYVVSFSGLSLAETRLMCVKIAQEVCEQLFGDRIDEVSVRSLIAGIVAPTGIDMAHAGAQIEATLECCGVETVTTKSSKSGLATPVMTIVQNGQGSLSSIEHIQNACAHLAKFDLQLGVFPNWELKRGLSRSVFLGPYSGGLGKSLVLGRKSLAGITGAQLIALEISQLLAAGAYALRVQNENKLCAVSVGVSYDSLCHFSSRIRYLTAMDKTFSSPTNPLLVRIERIPIGVPVGRVAELAAMLCLQNARVILEFSSLAFVPATFERWAIAGVGGSLPARVDDEAAKMIIKKLVTRADAQKAFAYIDNLDTPALVAMATEHHVRFGTGDALGVRILSGLGRIPDFPLKNWGQLRRNEDESKTLEFESPS